MTEKQYEVIITPFAESALQTCYDYIRYELLAEETADKWLDRMENAIQGLSILPRKYHTVEREPWHSNDIRCLSIIGYNIYYWINDNNMKVYIIDVVSHKMDQDKRLIESVLSHDRNADEGDA